MVWQDRKQLRGLMAQPLYRDGHVYTIDKGYGLTCFELKTGKKLWDDENRLTPRGRNPHASIVWLGDTDRVLALNSVGELVLARLTPEGYDEQSRTKVLGGRVWGHPAFAGRLMFAKTDGAEAWRKAGPHELVCVELVPDMMSEPGRAVAGGSTFAVSLLLHLLVHQHRELHRLALQVEIGP